jgi:cyclic pyranopterin phosphate synthase
MSKKRVTTKKAPTTRAAKPALTHLNAKGEAHMVDVGAKGTTARTARALAVVTMESATIARLASGDTPKGDVLATVRIAAIQATKRTPELIPLCHAIALTKVTVDIEIDARERLVYILVTTSATDRTGVEMEAMTGAAIGALTLYDMLKAIDRGITFDVRLVDKAGGKTGEWTRR